MHTKNHTTHKNSNIEIHKTHKIQNQKSLPRPYITQHKTNKTPISENKKAQNVDNPSLIMKLIKGI